MRKRLQDKYSYSLILLRELVRTDFKVKYQDSVLGYIWSVIKPLFMFAISYVIFVKVLRVGRGVENWGVALLTGIVLWQFFADVTKGTLKTIVSHGGLLRKIKLPRYIIIVAGTLSATITLAINSVVIGVFIALSGIDITWRAVFVVPFIIELFILSIGVAFFLSAVYVKFRDIQYIWEILSQALFYGSAILFPISYISDIGNKWLTSIALANPVAQIAQDVRRIVIGGDIPSLWTISDGNILLYAPPLAISLFAFVFGAWYFRRKSAHFAEYV